MVKDLRSTRKQIDNAKMRIEERMTKQNTSVDNRFHFAEVITGYAKLSHSWAGENVSKLLNIAIVVYGGFYG
jgi:hypothetical protein